MTELEPPGAWDLENCGDDSKAMFSALQAATEVLFSGAPESLWLAIWGCGLFGSRPVSGQHRSRSTACGSGLRRDTRWRQSFTPSSVESRGARETAGRNRLVLGGVTSEARARCSSFKKSIRIQFNGARVHAHSSTQGITAHWRIWDFACCGDRRPPSLHMELYGPQGGAYGSGTYWQ